MMVLGGPPGVYILSNSKFLGKMTVPVLSLFLLNEL